MPVTRICHGLRVLYVCSKLMVVDDVAAICGSANINDRSMVGTRDTEVAMVVHDQYFEDAAMNGSGSASSHASSRV